MTETPTIIPYTPEYQPPTDRIRDLDDDEEDVDKLQFGMPFSFWGKGWLNPVADAESATRAVLGGGGTNFGLDAVVEDLNRLV